MEDLWIVTLFKRNSTDTDARVFKSWENAVEWLSTFGPVHVHGGPKSELKKSLWSAKLNTQKYIGEIIFVRV